MAYFPRPVGSGIYAISNRLNGKLYIGSARDFVSRWRQHRMDLLRGSHHSRHLQRSFSKHPEDFEFVVIEQVKDKANLLKQEQFWINFYQAFDREKGYNISPKPGSCAGVKHSPEVAAKYRALLAQYRRQPGFNEKSLATRLAKAKARALSAPPKPPEGLRGTPVVQMDCDGKPVKRWSSIAKAEISFGCKPGKSNIGFACKGRRGFALGWKWKYDPEEKHITEAISEESAGARPHLHNQRSVLQISRLGTIIRTFESVKSAALFHKLSPAAISHAATHGRESVGFFWKYK